VARSAEADEAAVEKEHDEELIDHVVDLIGQVSRGRAAFAV
jgi:hypothetical protein